jgi:hypothetical protein
VSKVSRVRRVLEEILVVQEYRATLVLRETLVYQAHKEYRVILV